jgi:hypothetical protein
MTVSVLLWAICNVIKMADVKAVRKHKHMGKQLSNFMCLGVGGKEVVLVKAFSFSCPTAVSVLLS